jgi:hypothetical protein
MAREYRFKPVLAFVHISVFYQKNEKVKYASVKITQLFIVNLEENVPKRQIFSELNVTFYSFLL